MLILPWIINNILLKTTWRLSIWLQISINILLEVCQIDSSDESPPLSVSNTIELVLSALDLSRALKAINFTRLNSLKWVSGFENKAVMEWLEWSKKVYWCQHKVGSSGLSLAAIVKSVPTSKTYLLQKC